ncbi:hypothetical protein [Ruegeria arenilitoris]|uniref:hypothetical protein n=1 Tax=Ruegeria arenilitoris TaxID=1173585 RepID=UPI00147B2BF5|nr:hypothetical protein [Ruegeria arenilitoris]
MAAAPCFICEKRKTAVPREEEGNRRSFQHQGREEKSPDVSEPGFDPGVCKSRRHQGGGEVSPRAFNIKAGRRRALMYPNPGLIPVCVSRGDVREEEDVAARFQHREREEKYPVCQCPAFRAGIKCGDIREEERYRR